MGRWIALQPWLVITEIRCLSENTGSHQHTGLLQGPLKYQFDACRDIVSISWTGELLFSIGWHSPRDRVSLNILVPITIRGYPKDLLKHQFDACRGIVSISWTGKLLFSLGWQSHRDSVSIKLPVPIVALGYPKDLLKYQSGDCQGTVSISWPLFSLGWQSSRDTVSIKILIPIPILGWGQKRHLVKKFCYIRIYEMAKSIMKMCKWGWNFSKRRCRTW